VHLRHRFLRLLDGVDERQRHPVEVEVAELREEGGAEAFHGDSRSVGDEEDELALGHREPSARKLSIIIIALRFVSPQMPSRYVVPLESLRMTDVASVGGKNASLGELISQLAASGVRVPGGFATTAQAFEDFLTHNKLRERIQDALAKIDVDDVEALAKAGAAIR